MTDQPSVAPSWPQPTPPLPGGGTRKPTWWRRHWIHLVAAFVVGLGVGGAGGSASTADADARATAAEAKVAAAEKRSEAAVADAAAAKAAADKAAQDASKALAVKAADLDARVAQVAAREKAVGAAEAKAEANSFGDGVHVVGVDIQAGTYHTPGGDGTCYWAKLRQNDDIISNDLLDGPTTVTIEASVYKFQSKDCGTWTRR